MPDDANQSSKFRGDRVPELSSSRAPRHIHFFRTAIVGFAAGLLAVAFRRALGAAEHGREELLLALHVHPAWGWMVLPLIGLVAGGIAGLLTTRLASEAAGIGIPHLKAALLHVRSLHWRSLLPVKFIGGVLGIGAGLSLGREGPTVQMGAAVARALATGQSIAHADHRGYSSVLRPVPHSRGGVFRVRN